MTRPAAALSVKSLAAVTRSAAGVTVRGWVICVFIFAWQSAEPGARAAQGQRRGVDVEERLAHVASARGDA